MKEYPYWWDTVPESELKTENLEVGAGPRVESLTGRRFDVAIVGAGYTGLAAARQLAKSGAAAVVLEREDVGWGASSRNGGQVLAGLRLDAATLVRRYGESRARALFEIGLDAAATLERVVSEERIDCDLTRTGHIVAAWKRSHFEAFRETQALLARVFDHHVRLVPREQQREEVGSDLYHGLLVDEHSSALNPARYVRGLAAAARRAGATIICGTGVERVERRTSRWSLITSRGTVEATDVLMATNGYTNGAAPALQRRLVPIGSYIIATEPLAPSDALRLLPRRRVAYDSKHFLYYFRITADHRLLFGGRAEFARPDAATTRRAAATLRDGMRTVFPQLAGASIEYAWGGNVAFTRDEMPRAGKLEGVYYAGGYCGHGIALATHLGTLIARRIAGESIQHPMFDDRFAPIPLYYGRPWFLPAVGAYYKLKDWLP